MIYFTLNFDHQLTINHKSIRLYSIGFTKNFTSYKNASVGYERYQKLLLKII